MQVIAPDFYASFAGPSSSQAEERPGDGLFDSLLREEEARYKEAPQPKRDHPEAVRPARDDVARDEQPPEEHRDEVPLRETSASQEDRPSEDPNPRRDAETAADDGSRPGKKDNHPAASTGDDTVAKPAETAAEETPVVRPQPQPQPQPQGGLGQAVAATQQNSSTVATAPQAQPTAQVAPAATETAAKTAPTRTSAGTAPATQPDSKPTALPQTSDAPVTAPAKTSALPASAAAPAEKAAEHASTTTTSKPASQVAAAHPPSPRQPIPVASGERTNPAASTRGATPDAGIVVESSETLSSRPAAALGGGAATAALAQANGPATAARTATQGGSGETVQTNSAQKPDAQPGSQAKVPEVALSTAADKAIQVSPALGGGSGGETSGHAGGQSSSLATPLAGNGAVPASSSQSTSFAETMANTRNTASADPAEQIAVQVRRAQVAGQEQINIKLHPAELGRIEVRLESNNDGTLRAVISAERSETLDLLQRDSRGLERALQEAGVKTDSGSLNFSLRGQGQNQGQQADGDGGSQPRSTDRGDGPAEGPDLPAAEAQAYRSSHDGALDIRV